MISLFLKVLVFACESFKITEFELVRSKDGAVVRALAYHQCDPGSIPGSSAAICWLGLWMVRVEGFSPDSPVFLPPQKRTLQILILPLYVTFFRVTELN